MRTADRTLILLVAEDAAPARSVRSGCVLVPDFNAADDRLSRAVGDGMALDG